MARRTEAPPAIVEWLQTLLRERFHDGIRLRVSREGRYEISVPGSERRVRLVSDFGTFLGAPETLPCGRWTPGPAPWLTRIAESLPTPGLAEPRAMLVEHDAHGHVVHYDVLSMAWWMMSRYEEAGNPNVDEHERFLAEASHAFRHGYLERPIVDEWFLVLGAVMQATWPGLNLHEHRYGLVLSHDVDTPARYGLISAWRLGRTMLVDLFRDRHRDRRALLAAPSIWATSRKRLDPRDPFNTFDWIMDRSEAAGLRNAFYFLCGQTDPERDGHYSPDDRAIVDLMQRIDARGHEVGLHASFNTFRDPAGLLGEARRLQQTCERAGIELTGIGVRMHYLRWETPTTLRALETAGIAYDTSLGYPKRPGFRCGTCHEYQAFDVARGAALKLRLRPLIVMESTVMRPLNPENFDEVKARLQKLMQACRRVQGKFTLLWHNTMLEHPLQRKLYEQVLQLHGEQA